MKRVIFLSLLYSISFLAKAQQSNEKVFENTPVLYGDVIEFPITMVDAYPFISGEINGVKGKFMFDTGIRSAININDNLVKLPNKKPVNNGIVGSGQKFVLNLNDTISEVKFNGFTYHNLLKISSANYNFLEQITPDCIGYIGYDFFKGYLFKLDYLRRKITFYKSTTERESSKDFLAGEKVLAVLNFQTRRLPNHPMIKVNIGGVDVIGSFDTGQFGLLQVQDEQKKMLMDKSFIVPAGKDAFGSNVLDVNGIVMDGKFETSLKGVYTGTLKSTEPQRKGTEITEPHMMVFGYRFLDQYKTVWDFEAKKIYVLEK